MRKHLSIKKLLFLLVAPLVIGSASGCANDCHTCNTDDPAPYPITFTNDGHDDILFYSDNYFRHRATSYNPHLATLSIHMAKYSMNTGGPDSIEDYKWYAEQPKRLTQFFGAIGFNNPQFNHDYYTRTGLNTIGIGAASKKIKEGDNEFTVIACTVRSGGYFLEWENNVMLGDGTKSDYMHEGWYNAANRVIDFIGDYIRVVGIEGQIKLWLAGFSRGGAVMNITGGLLDNKLGMDDQKTRYEIYDKVNLKREDILVYTFEAPQGANYNSLKVAPPKDPLYNNIFNIVNPNDFVTKVGMGIYGFTRFGIDKFITTFFFDHENFDNNRKNLKTVYTIWDHWQEPSWSFDTFDMYTIPFTDIATDIASLPNIVSDIVKWANGESVIPQFIKKDDYKKHYDANIATTILIDRFVPALGTRDEYVEKYQNLAIKMMGYLFNDDPTTNPMSWKEFAIALAIQGVGYTLFGDIKAVLDLQELTGEDSQIIEDLLGAVADTFWDYPSEFASVISNAGNVFDNHSTQINIAHAQVQDSYYQEWYNKYYSVKYDLVPYRNQASIYRFSCHDINQGEIHNRDQGSNIVLRMSGSDWEWSTLLNFDPGYALGYYHYATYEGSEWFMPTCYNYAYGFYDYSMHADHLVEISLITYYTNGPSYRNWETIFIDEDVSYNVEEAITGQVDKLG